MLRVGGNKELMPFSSLLKGSVPKGKQKKGSKMGSLGASPLAAPHCTSASFSPPGGSATLPRTPKATSAATHRGSSLSIPGLVRTSLEPGMGSMSVSPKSGPMSPVAKERSKRVLGTPTKERPVPKYRNPLQLFRSPEKEEPSPTKITSLDVPAYRLDDSDGDEVGMSVRIVNKNKKKPEQVSNLSEFNYKSNSEFN